MQLVLQHSAKGVQKQPRPQSFALALGTRLINKLQRNFLSVSKLECGPQEINSREICLH